MAKYKNAISIITAYGVGVESVDEGVTPQWGRGRGLYVHTVYKIRMAARQPHPRDSHAAIGIGSKLYLWGGYSEGSTIRTTTLEIFDVSSLTWEQPQVLRGSDMPDGLWGMAATTDGETRYTFGGVSGSYPHSYHSLLLQVAPSQHLCQELQPTSPSHTAPKRTSHGCIAQFQDKLVLHGGYTGERRSSELHVFDLTNSKCELYH